MLSHYMFRTPKEQTCGYSMLGKAKDSNGSCGKSGQLFKHHGVAVKLSGCSLGMVWTPPPLQPLLPWNLASWLWPVTLFFRLGCCGDVGSRIQISRVKTKQIIFNQPHLIVASCADTGNCYKLQPIYGIQFSRQELNRGVSQLPASAYQPPAFLLVSHLSTIQNQICLAFEIWQHGLSRSGNGDTNKQ